MVSPGLQSKLRLLIMDPLICGDYTPDQSHATQSIPFAKDHDGGKDPSREEKGYIGNASFPRKILNMLEF